MRLASPEPDAAPPSAHEISVAWEAPTECPDGPALVAAIERLSGRALTIRPDAGQHIDGRIRATATGYALHLELTSPREHAARDLEAPDCVAVVDAASLVVVTRWLSTDTPEASSSSVPPPPAAASREPSATSTMDQPPVPAPPRPELRPVGHPATVVDTSPSRAPRPATPITPPRLAFAALGGGAFGFTPRPTGSIAASLGLVFDHGRAEVQVQHAFATASDDVSPGRVRAATTRIAALGCYTPTAARLDFPLCTGLELGVAVGRGEGELAASSVGRQTWVGLPVQAGLGWAPVPRFAVRATGGISIGLRRPGFHLAAPEGPRAPNRLKR